MLDNSVVMVYAGLMKKTVGVVILFVVALIGAGLAVWALTTNADVRTPSRAVSKHSVTHHHMAAVNLPSVATTTTTPAVATPGFTTTTTAVRSVTPASTQPKAVMPTTTTTTTTPVAVKTVIPTTIPANGSNVTVQISTVGFMTAPDKTSCESGAGQECVLVTVVNPVFRGTSGPSIIVTNATDDTVGTFVAAYQSYCLIHWAIVPSGTAASSPDCSGGPLQSSQDAIDFSYASPTS